MNFSGNHHKKEKNEPSLTLVLPLGKKRKKEKESGGNVHDPLNYGSALPNLIHPEAKHDFHETL